MFHVVITGGDIGRLKDKRGIGSGDSYRVLLIDDIRHTEKLGNFIHKLPYLTSMHSLELDVEEGNCKATYIYVS